MSQCPGLVRVGQTPGTPPARAATTALGFAATQTDEGLVVHNVPIFCACARGDIQFDEVWIKAAVEKAMSRQRGNYNPPLHIRHHKDVAEANDPVRAAGFFRVTGTGPITLNKTRRTAIFADLVFTDPNAAHEAMSMRLPYRSVEIFNVEKEPSIDGLALLDHEAPYLELPMLKVGEVTEARSEGVAGATFQHLDESSERASVVAFSRQGNTVSLTFREDQDMGSKKTESPPDPKATSKTQSGQQNFDIDPNGPDPKKFAEDEGGGEGATAPLDVAAVCKAIESGEISVSDMDSILAAIQSQNSEPKPEPEAEVAPAPSPGEVMKAPTEKGMSFATALGKIDALEAANLQRDETDKRKGEVDAAMVRLSGLPLGADLHDKLNKFHASYGSTAFGDYVESFAHNTPAAHNSDDPKAAAFDAQGGKLPDVAMSYSEQGTDAVNRAASFAKEWEQLQGSGIKTSLDAYVKSNMARAQPA